MADEISGQLRHVTEHRADAKESGGALQVLQMPVEEGEHETVTKPHDPGHKENRTIADATNDPEEIFEGKRLQVASGHTGASSVLDSGDETF